MWVAGSSRGWRGPYARGTLVRAGVGAAGAEPSTSLRVRSSLAQSAGRRSSLGSAVARRLVAAHRLGLDVGAEGRSVEVTGVAV